MFLFFSLLPGPFRSGLVSINGLVCIARPRYYRLTGFDWVLLGCYWVVTGLLLGCGGFYRVLLRYTGFHLFSLGVLLGFTGFYWVLLGVT